MGSLKKGHAEPGGDQVAAVFESSRPRLLGLAYRILGSHAEAEDAVQDTFLRWRSADRDEIASPCSWLTTVCTRRAIDMLRAAHRSRVDYVGHWLPEPLHTTIEPEVEQNMDVAATLSTAFLLMLERLTAKERAAYLLYEVFDLSYGDVSASLDINEVSCRKLVSRAKASLAQSKPRSLPTRARQKILLAAFEDAIRTGSPTTLTALLVDDVRLAADGGGKVVTALEVRSAQQVIDFLTQRLHEWWGAFDWSVTELNGALGLILREGEQAVATVTFEYDDAYRITDIFIVRNPDKLVRLHAVAVH